MPFLTLNDFNWHVIPSDDSLREFGLLYGAVRDVLDRTAYVFRYDAHEKELREFIKQYLKVPSKPLPVGFTVQYSQVENFGSTTHAQPNANPNASYYDIRECFQGRNNNKGKMNAKSSDESYNQLLSTLKEAMEILRLQIVPKVYAYKFLMA